MPSGPGAVLGRGKRVTESPGQPGGSGMRTGLEDNAMVALLRALGPDEERCAGRVLEHLPDALTRPRRALEIVPGTNLLCYRHALQRVRISTNANAGRAAAPSHTEGAWQEHKMATHLLRGNRPLVRLPELLNDSGVPPEILLAADEDDGKAGAKVHNLGNPLLSRG